VVNQRKLKVILVNINIIPETIQVTTNQEGSRPLVSVSTVDISIQRILQNLYDFTPEP
jgi:hypothetical protein